LANYAEEIIFNSQFGKKYVETEKLPITIEMSGSSLCVSGLFVDVNTSTSEWEKNKSNILSLSDSEKQLFVLLAANMNERFPLIVKGPTASGKTFTIQLFARVIGHKLTVLQMNSDSSVAAIIGGYKPSETVTNNKIEAIKDKLSACEQLFEDIISDFNNNPNITTKFLTEINSRIQKTMEEVTDVKMKEKIKSAIAEIDNACTLFNRVELSDSIFVKAMVNGDWILLDGIESAPSDVIERIIPLLSPVPTLNLYEHGDDSVYSAHPHFRIFITYNPHVSNKKTVLL
jgi:midasin (ATPase involved in ribosome maturation)